MRTSLRQLAPLLLRGSPSDRRSQALPVAAFAVVTALTLTVAGGAEFFVRLDESSGVDASYQGVYASLAAVALVILAVPLLSLCGSAVRLSTRRRDTRLASLRLLGAPRSLLVRLSILEAGIVATLGVALGIVGHLLLAPVFGLIPFLGGPIGAGAVLPSVPVALVTVVALVGMAVAGAALGLRTVAITPLGVRTRQAPAVPHWARAAIAVGVLVALVAAGQQVGEHAQVVGIAIALVMLGLGLAVLNVIGPWVLKVLAWMSLRRAGGGPRGATRLLAARAVLDDPRAVWRQVGGAAMVSFVSVVVGTGLAMTNTASPELMSPADVMLNRDLGAGVYLTIGLAFLTLAASMTVHAAAEVYDRRDLYVALDRLGTPRRTLESARRRAVLSPLVAICLVGAGAGALMVLPLAGIAMVTDPLTLISILASLVLGVVVVRTAVGSTTPLLRQVLANPEPVV
ncbi:FtsX-like permease family protein [Ornithinimicrobium sp. Y1694]|uniref:FtsX-like permease family protein n=1 Tax=Ornithinimicrobium sp. Y1694 TaxID=3418590 RepID=UPI003CF13141